MLGQLHPLPVNPLAGIVTPPPAFADTFLKALQTALEKHYADECFGALELSKLLFLCPMQVHRKVKQRTGLSPGRLLLLFRLKKAQVLLRSTDLPIGEIAWRCGFASQNYFARAFHKEMGQTPKAARQKSRLELC
jgi:AraC family transcriptional regulator